MWLAKKAGRLQALRWQRDKSAKFRRNHQETYQDGQQMRVAQPQLEIYSPHAARDVETGTSKAGSATCPISGYTTSVESIAGS